MAGTKGVNTAIEYLNKEFPVTLIPDKLFSLAKCSGKLSSIEKGLRRARAIGRVKVEYMPNETGTDMIAHYQGVPGWTKPKDSVEAVSKSVEKVIDAHNPAPASPFPAVFFYELAPYDGKYSPYYTSMEALEKAMPAEGGHRYTGSHEKPIRISGGPNPK